MSWPWSNTSLKKPCSHYFSPCSMWWWFVSQISLNYICKLCEVILFLNYFSEPSLIYMYIIRINFTTLVGHNQLASYQSSIIPVIFFKELLLFRNHDFSIYAAVVLFLHKKSNKNPSNIAAVCRSITIIAFWTCYFEIFHDIIQ